MESGTRFAAPWGGLLKVLTVLSTLLMAGGLVLIWWSPVPDVMRWLTGSVLAVVLVAGPFFRVMGYRVGRGVLQVERPGWETSIPLTGLTSIERTGGRALAGVRLFGNGGFWSFTGWYWNSRLGRYRCFVNDPSRAVAMRFARGCVVVAPDDPDRFIREVRAVSGPG